MLPALVLAANRVIPSIEVVRAPMFGRQPPPTLGAIHTREGAWR
jgi:hypothetical protein